MRYCVFNVASLVYYTEQTENFPGVTRSLLRWKRFVTARCVCTAQTMPWQDVYPFVHLSVHHTLVLCVNGYTYPQSFFSPSGSPLILVFPYQTVWQYSDKDPPPNGGTECDVLSYIASVRSSKIVVID